MAEMTIEAAIIELNRLKSQERMDIDRERLNAAIDTLTKAARYRIPQKAHRDFEISLNFDGARCPLCEFTVDRYENRFCGHCGQAIDYDN